MPANMPDIRFFNSLSGKKEPFSVPEGEKAKLYHCGPTVYDFVHIGNLRSIIFADTIRRSLETLDIKTEQTINITDVGHLSGDTDEGEDKMTKALLREGKPLTIESMLELGTFYMERFKEDTAAINVLPPHHLPRASGSEYISEDLSIIQKLLSKGLAYETKDGVYFDTENYPEYGKLKGVPAVENDAPKPKDKKNSRDFALWKKNASIGFESPYGKGFPGWHIECSAMSMRTLKTETLDIHSGGIDLAPIHHNNEIAQSEGTTGKPFARFFMHSGFVNMGMEKMAKSVGNVVRLKDITEKGFHPLSLRFLFLMAHYRTPMEFSWESLEAAQSSLEKIVHNFALTGEASPNPRLKEYLADDLNTPQAIAELNSGTIDADFMEKALGIPLSLLAEEAKKTTPEIESLLSERELSRNNGDFAMADEIRDKISSLGYVLFDAPSGTYTLKRLSF